ncbi:MAG: GNAT family N-acetyltransferase [Actinobacteria bacterium]|nr:GNAT family N-acetyltransferase [Actinomycetota bacterium]
MFAIEIITDLEDFKALKEEWNALAAEAGMSVFQTWQWSWHWWRENGKGKKLLIIAARDASGLAALAPLYITSTFFALPLKIVSFIGTEGTDYLDVIAATARDDAVSAIFKELLSLSMWDAVDLHQIPQSSQTCEIVRLAVADNLNGEVLAQDKSYTRALDSTWEVFLAGLSKKFRTNVRYYRRRLERDYSPVIRQSDCESVTEDMRLFFKLHRKRFLSKKKPGAYLNPKFRRFHSELARDLCETGWLRLYILEVDGKPVAAMYGFAFGGSFYYYLGGFEPDWGSLNVSTILIAQSIEDAIGEGLARYDFLRGDEPYKQKWGAVASGNRRVIIGRAGTKSGVVKKMLAMENDVTKKAKEIMEKA